MELQSLSKPSVVSRRSWLAVPFAMIAGAALYLGRQRAIPNASDNGSGDPVLIVLFSDSGRRLQTVRVKKLVKSLDEWRKQLGPESFAVTRRQATEFSFHNAYWNNHKAGLYRCVCCGNTVFASNDKFNSDTGWPSFTAPVASENITTRPDRSLGLVRTEVLCRKCDAHLGHVFDDGPPPTHNRYCLNSAALRFLQTS